jgi:hypothetical protein
MLRKTAIRGDYVEIGLRYAERLDKGMLFPLSLN